MNLNEIIAFPSQKQQMYQKPKNKNIILLLVLICKSCVCLQCILHCVQLQFHWTYSICSIVCWFIWQASLPYNWRQEKSLKCKQRKWYKINCLLNDVNLTWCVLYVFERKYNGSESLSYYCRFTFRMNPRCKCDSIFLFQWNLLNINDLNAIGFGVINTIVDFVCALMYQY